MNQNQSSIVSSSPSNTVLSILELNVHLAIDDVSSTADKFASIADEINSTTVSLNPSYSFQLIIKYKNKINLK